MGPSGASAVDLAQHPRNRRLRVHNAMGESMGDIIAIWNGIAMVILFDVSSDGKSPVDVSRLFLAGLVQTAFELLADLISIILLRLNGLQILDMARGRYWYWSATFSCSIMFMSGWCFESLLIRALCRDLNFEPATWAPCGKL